MRRAVLAIFLILLPAIACAQPLISFDSESYDFGTVSQGKAVEHTFEFSNGGDAELVIGRLVPS